jgi:hypothetical protein
MTPTEKPLIDIAAFRKQIQQSFIALVFIVAGTSIGFYYNTTNAIGQTAREIEYLKDCQIRNDNNINSLNINKLDRNEYREDLKEIKELIKDIKNDIKKL